MIEDRELWQAVLERNREYDGTFVYAVRSTGIYCRPSCASRRPQREQVLFFSQATLAEQAGFRACRRCHPDRPAADEPHMELVERMCRYIEERAEDVPTLGELARRFDMSPYYLQRTFKRLVGVTPRQYAAGHRLDRFRAHLKDGESVTEALYEAGYRSSSSAYEQAKEQLGMTPTSYRRGGSAAAISYTIVPCALGYLLVAATPRGICAVRLGDSEAELQTGLLREFPAATVQRGGDLERWVAVLLEYLRGTQPHLDLPLDIQATAFQRRVWEALRAVPYGGTRTYRDIAEAIGQPTATRAVGHACATNPVALIIPCHRIVRRDGNLGGYHWGIERKRALLAQESRESHRRDAETAEKEEKREIA